MLANLAEREKLYGELFPWEHANFGMDESWVHCKPCEQSASPGGELRLEAVLTNHSNRAHEASVRLVPPVSWQVQRPDAVTGRILRRFVRAWEAVDVDGIVALLREDAVLTMPPFPMRFVGPREIGEFLSRVPAGGALDQIRLVPMRANYQPAVAAYMFAPKERVHRAYGIMVLTLDNDRVVEITGFSDPSLFAAFGLPMQLETGH